MTQHQEYDAPIHNSIGPLNVFIENKVNVGLGVDNIEDIFIEIEEAQKGIQSNGNANMIFMDLSLKLTRLIQKQ